MSERSFQKIEGATYSKRPAGKGGGKPMATAHTPKPSERHLIPPVASFGMVGVMNRGKWTTLIPSIPSRVGTQTIQRSVDGGATWTNLATISAVAPSFSDPAPPAGPAQYRAMDNTGRVSATITITPPAAPSTPTAHYATGVVTLSWTDNNPAGANHSTGFTLERSVDFMNWAAVATVSGSVLSTTDTPPAGNIFFYRVRSQTASGTSAPSGWALVGPAIYGWLRASDITAADGASIGSTWTDKIAGHLTLTKPAGSTWTYKASGIGGRPEIKTDATGWNINATLPQPFCFVWVGENLGPNVTDTQSRPWLNPTGNSGLQLEDAQNPFNGFLMRDKGTGGYFEPAAQCAVANIWVGVANGAASSLTQQGVGAGMLQGGISSGASLMPGTLRAAVGLSEFLILSCAPTTFELSGLNAAFSQFYGIRMASGAATLDTDLIVTPIIQTPVVAPYTLGSTRVDGSPAQTWYVSATGSNTNAGTLDAPWDLASVLSPAGNVISSLKPGDGVLVRGGTYTSPFGPENLGFAFTLQGAAGHYITIMPAPGEHVIIDGGIDAQSPGAPANYVMISGFEVFNSETKLVRDNTGALVPIIFNTTTPWRQGGINGGGNYNIWSELIIHDINQNNEFDGVGTDFCDLVIWDIGYLTDSAPGVPARNQGHYDYTHNESLVQKLLNGCYFGPDIAGGSAAFGLHLYSETGQINNFVIDGCVSNNWSADASRAISNVAELGAGGSGGTIQNLVWNNSISYNVMNQVGGVNNHYANCVANGNIIAGTSTMAPNASPYPIGYTQTNLLTAPAITIATVLRPHRYNANAATLTIVSDGRAGTLVDLSAFLDVGDTYSIVDVENVWGTALATGTYDGGPVLVPAPTLKTACFCCWIYKSAPAAPATPANLAVTATSGSSLTLTWSTSDNAWQSFVVKRAAAPGGPYTTVATVQGRTYTDTGLTPETEYYYVVSAVNSYGVSGNSVEASGFAPGIPAQVTGVSAMASSGEVVLTWAGQAGMAAATSYNVMRSMVSGGPYTNIGVTSANSFADTGLTNGTTYYYVIVGVNAAGTGANSAEVSGTPSFPGTKTLPGCIAFYSAAVDLLNPSGHAPNDGDNIALANDEITPASNRLTCPSAYPIYLANGMGTGKPGIDFTTSTGTLSTTTLSPNGFTAVSIDLAIMISARPASSKEILTIGLPGNQTVRLFLNTNGSVEASAEYATGLSDVAGDGVIPTLNTRTHYTVTHDGTTLSLYRGGVRVAQNGAAHALKWGSASLELGGQGAGTPAMVDLVAVFDRALTADEVLDIAGT